MLNAKNIIIALGFFMLIVGVTSLTVIVPAATFNPEPTPGLRPYTQTELAGRQIFQRENCYVCHSQFVRFQDEGVGPTSQAGDFAYDRGNLLGTLRNGPDLSYEGGLYPDEWHIGHLKRPRSYLPGSYMPSYDYLSDTEIRSLVGYVQSLGTRNTRSWETKDVNIPEKYRDLKSPFGQNNANIGAGRGIFNQNCAACHGFGGRADVPLARVFYPKPAANFHLPRYKDFTDGHWYNKTARGVPGTRMPRWDQTLNTEQIWYVVAYLKSLAADQDLTPKTGREQYYDKKVLQPGDTERKYVGAPKAAGGH